MKSEKDVEIFYSYAYNDKNHFFPSSGVDDVGTWGSIRGGGGGGRNTPGRLMLRIPMETEINSVLMGPLFD